MGSNYILPFSIPKICRYTIVPKQIKIIKKKRKRPANLLILPTSNYLRDDISNSTVGNF